MNGIRGYCVKDKEDIRCNIRKLYIALQARSKKARSLIGSGTNFVAALEGGRYIFAPSRFVGQVFWDEGHDLYLGVEAYEPATSGTEINEVISRVLNTELLKKRSRAWHKFENAYLDFCWKFSIKPKKFKTQDINKIRKYWLFDADSGTQPTGKSGGKHKGRILYDVDLPANELSLLTEGRLKKVENHLRRERNPDVRKRLLVQKIYKKYLFCDMCGYEHRRIDSRIEEAQFEAHHNIPLKEGERDTDINDISLLCSNCHRLIHRLMTFHEGKVIKPDEAKDMLAKEGVNIHC